MSDATDPITMGDYHAAVHAAAVAVCMLRLHPLSAILQSIERAEALGPMIDPTLWRAKSQAMREDAALLTAAIAFVNAASRLARTR